MNKLTTLHTRVFKESTQLYDVVNGFFPPSDVDGVSELGASISRWMKKYKIGRHLKKDKWGRSKADGIRDALYKTFDVQDGTVTPTKVSTQPLALYDQIKQNISTVGVTNYDIERVARTEAARIRAVAQLNLWKEAGVTQVQHITKNDQRVSPICKAHANKVFEIDYLLSNDNDRVPLHVNCRCTYKPHIVLK